MLEFITFEGLFISFWTLATVCIFLLGLVTLKVTTYVPQFIQTLILYGKYGSLNQAHNSHGSREFVKSSSFYVEMLTPTLTLINKLVKRCEVPKRYFQHFYIFSMAINVSIVWHQYSLFKYTDHVMNIPYLTLIACQLVQSARRIVETQFIAIYSKSKFSINWIYLLTRLFLDHR